MCFYILLIFSIFIVELGILFMSSLTSAYLSLAIIGITAVLHLQIRKLRIPHASTFKIVVSAARLYKILKMRQPLLVLLHKKI